MQMPSKGRVIHVRGLPNFGEDIHAAMVQNVLVHEGGPVLVNCVIFPDMGAPQNLHGVHFFQTKAEADLHYLHELKHGHNTAHVAYWPPRD